MPGLEAYAPGCGQGGGGEADVSGRRGTLWALVEEADAPNLWTKGWTRRAVDDKEADAPGWRLAGTMMTGRSPSM